MRRRLLEDPDYVVNKRHGDDLETVCDHYPDGAPDRVIASALMITEAEVSAEYDGITAILRHFMGG